MFNKKTDCCHGDSCSAITENYVECCKCNKIILCEKGYLYSFIPRRIICLQCLAFLRTEKPFRLLLWDKFQLMLCVMTCICFVLVLFLVFFWVPSFLDRKNEVLGWGWIVAWLGLFVYVVVSTKKK